MHLLAKFGIYRQKTAIRGFLAVLNERLEKSAKNRQNEEIYFQSLREIKIVKSPTV